MKKTLATLLAVVLVLGVCPVCTAAAESVYTDYYGREALAKLPNAPSLLYAYDQIAAGIENTISPISVSNGTNTLSAEELDVVMDAYRRDYAHHFWLGNRYSYSHSGGNVSKVMPDYLLQGDVLEFARIAMEEAADEILAGITSSMSDFEKELYLHDALAARVTYVESENAHNAYGALVDGEAVCEGYAEALQYLLHRVGIRSFIAIGSSVNPGSQQSEGHAWNYVRINGQYYHVDLTWNDQDQNIYHAYFNVDDATIMQDHAVEDTPLALPTCNSTAANYFKVKGGWLDSYTVESVAKLLRKNNLSVSVYIPGDIDTFTDWYYDNIRDIAKAIPIEGGYSYGYSRMGHEMILRMSGTIGEIPEEPDDPVEPDVPVGPDDPVDPEPVKDGWVKEGSRWAYYEQGARVVNRWVKDSVGWCYLGEDGYAVSDCWKQDSVGWCYLNSNGSMTKNAWVKTDGQWYYLDGNGYRVTNAWKKDSKGWVYVGADGAMKTNAWVRDSIGWCYVGADGYAVTNCWKKDSVGWCYLNSNGSMTKNAWVKDGNKWYYLDGDGYMVTNAWKKDSKGWVYVGADGAMKTNAWVRDSIGWCYVGADGYAVTNCWKQDSVGWCYLNSNGSMTKNAWIQDGGEWYYLDGDGYMVAGKTLTIGGKTYTFGKNGALIS